MQVTFDDKKKKFDISSLIAIVPNSKEMLQRLDWKQSPIFLSK